MASNCESVTARAIVERDELRSLTDSELRARAARLREIAEPLSDEQVVEALALVAAASDRVLGRTYGERDVLAGAAMALGLAAETPDRHGNGIALLFPAFVGSLEGRGVHVLSANEDLVADGARRASDVLSVLGLRTGLVTGSLSGQQRSEAYRADVTYGFFTTFVTDYLRDGLAIHDVELVQRGLQSAIMDEADTIAIDLARSVPSVAVERHTDPAELAESAKFVSRLRLGAHYEVRGGHVQMSGKGIKSVEKKFGKRALLDASSPGFLAKLESSIRLKYGIGIHEDLVLARMTVASYLKGYRNLVGLVAYPDVSAALLDEIYGLRVVRTRTGSRHGDGQVASITIYESSGRRDEALTTLVSDARGEGLPVIVGVGGQSAGSRVGQTLASAGIPSVEYQPSSSQAIEVSVLVADADRGAVRALVRRRGVGGLAGVEPPSIAVYCLGYGSAVSARSAMDDLVGGDGVRVGRVLLAADEQPCSLIDDRDMLQGNIIGAPVVVSEEPQSRLRLAISNAQTAVEDDTSHQLRQGLAFDDIVEKRRKMMEKLRKSVADPREADRLMRSALDDPASNQAYDRRCHELSDALMQELRRRVILEAIDMSWREFLAEMHVAMKYIGTFGMGDPLESYEDIASVRYVEATRRRGERALEYFHAVRV